MLCIRHINRILGPDSFYTNFSHKNTVWVNNYSVFLKFDDFNLSRGLIKQVGIRNKKIKLQQGNEDLFY